MKTAKEIEKEFVDELKALLKKYEATLEADDSGSTESKQDIKMLVTIPSQYNGDERIGAYTEIDLGRFFPYNF